MSLSEASEAFTKETVCLVAWSQSLSPQPAQGASWAFMDDRSTAAKSRSHDEAEIVFENILKCMEESDGASAKTWASGRSGPELERSELNIWESPLRLPTLRSLWCCVMGGKS